MPRWLRRSVGGGFKVGDRVKLRNYYSPGCDVGVVMGKISDPDYVAIE